MFAYGTSVTERVDKICTRPYSYMWASRCTCMRMWQYAISLHGILGFLTRAAVLNELPPMVMRCSKVDL